MTDWTIRPARVADATNLATLNRCAQALHVAARPDDFKAPDQTELETWYHALLEASTTRAFLAELGEDSVGYVLAILRRTEENPFASARRWLELDQIAVVPAQRGRGIARALTAQVIALAQAEGLARVELNSWSFNETAHAVFAQLGFTPQRVRFERRVD